LKDHIQIQVGEMLAEKQITDSQYFGVFIVPVEDKDNGSFKSLFIHEWLVYKACS
jgi:hypothetical protein